MLHKKEKRNAWVDFGFSKHGTQLKKMNKYCKETHMPLQKKHFFCLVLIISRCPGPLFYAFALPAVTDVCCSHQQKPLGLKNANAEMP